MRETVQQLIDRLQIKRVLVEERAEGPNGEDVMLGLYEYDNGKISSYDKDDYSTEEIVESYYFDSVNNNGILVVYIETEWEM